MDYWSPDDNDEREKNQQRNEMENLQSREVKRQVLPIPPCKKCERDIFHSIEGPPDDREAEILYLPQWISPLVSEPGIVRHPDLFCLIKDGGEKTEGERNHEADSTRRNKWKRSQEPHQRILNLSGASDRREENRISQNDRDAPAVQGSQAKSFSADRNTLKNAGSGRVREEDLKNK
jgi:hypothetical protein